MRGTQRVGADPLQRQLKSWSFDSDGGHTEAVWTKDGDSWVEQASGVLPDGRTATSTVVITRDGANSYTRKTLAARVAGQPIADQELRFTRQTGAKP